MSQNFLDMLYYITYNTYYEYKPCTVRETRPVLPQAMVFRLDGCSFHVAHA